MAGVGRVDDAVKGVDQAGRAIAGLLGYNPGPGIYSRLERAVEAMPENVRVQELPGLIKRYKDGVPGWELKAVDLDSLTAGRDVIPRQEILAAVRERSPVYTHREKMLGGDDQSRSRLPYAQIGESSPSARPLFGDYGQGGDDYKEVLLLQPGAVGENYGSHWNGVFGANNAVAHARFDVHDGYLRVNELQSDLGIHNRKMREQYPSASTGDADELPLAAGPGYKGPATGELPFPLEDAWSDLLLKRLNLYAAQNGLRGVEIASPRAIADKVGGNIANYEHAYGKVAVGNQQRLGRRLGGMAEEVKPQGSNAYEENLEELRRAYNEPGAEALSLLGQMRGGRISRRPQPAFEPTVLERFDSLDHAYQGGMREPPAGVWDADFENRRAFVRIASEELYSTLVEDLVSRGMDPSAASRQAADAMPRLVRLAEEQAARNVDFVRAQIAPHSPPPPKDPSVVYRGTMSDEMRRRILQEGIPAAVAIGIGTDQVLDRLDKEAPRPQMR